MATQRQKRVAKLIVENATLDKPLNGGEILDNTGYSKGIQKDPKVVFESFGVKSELAILGFTEHNAKSVVSEIMNNGDVEPNARLKAADMTFKVHGSYAPEKSVSVSLELGVSEEDLSLANKLLEQRRLKASSTKSDGVTSVVVGGEVSNKE